MNENRYSNIEFDFMGRSVKEYIKSLKLKNQEGYELFFYSNDFFPYIYGNEAENIYFFEFTINANHEQREQIRQKLIKRYKKRYAYLRSVLEYILLIQNNIVRIFADVHGFPDGISVNLLDVIAPDFEKSDMVWLKKIIRKAFLAENRGVPEFYYTDRS